MVIGRPYFSIIVVLFIFGLLNIPVFSQLNEIQCTQITSENGLSLNTVTQIIQDKKGYIWFGTYNGLNKYDGYNFKTYFLDPQNPQSISNHSIWSLTEDHEGYIWVGTIDGLNKFDPVTEKFTRYKREQNNNKSLSNNIVNTIFEDSRNNLWIGTLNGLSLYDRESGNFKRIMKVNSRFNPDSLNSVVCMEEDERGILWLGTWNGITCVQKNGDIVKTYFEDKPNDKNFEYRKILSLFKDRKNNIWAGTNGKGLFRYDENKDDFIKYTHNNRNDKSISSNIVNTINQSRDGNLWVGTDNGLNNFNPETGAFINYFYDEKKPLSLISNEVKCIMEDYNGLIWVGTGEGVSRFMVFPEQFHYLPDLELFRKNNIINDRIYSLLIDKKNNLWIGGFDGLDKVNIRERTVKKFRTRNDDGRYINDNFVRKLYEDGNGIIWIGTNSNGLNRYDPATGKFTYFKYNVNDSTSISNNSIISILKDHNGYLWLGTWWGLNKYDERTNSFKRYHHRRNKPNSINNNIIWSICEDRDGIIWLGTDGSGVDRFDPKTDQFTYLNEESGKRRISSNRVFVIKESRNGLLWFGTNNGLTCYNKLTDSTIIYDKKSGVIGTMVTSIQEDDKEQIWFATEKGLTVLNQSTGECTNYKKRDGLRNLEFDQDISAKSDDGYIYFCTRDGILFFHPDSLVKNSSNAAVVFNDVKIYNKSLEIGKNGILSKSINYTDKISIPPGNDVITIEFSLLDYYNVKNNFYRYKLEGFDDDWSYVGERNSATYTNLPPGKYTFKVMAKSGGALKFDKENQLAIIIEPKYFQTLWFKVLIILLFLTVLWLALKVRTKTIMRQNKMLEHKVFERTKDLDKTIKELNQEIASKDKFFSIIAHDLRSPFLALLGFSKYLVDEIEEITKDDLKIVSENILKSAKMTFNLLENLLYWARIKTGRIKFEPSKINLNSVITDLVELYKNNADGKGIDIHLNCDPGICAFADPNMLQTVLRNLLSNAIKFTDSDGKIAINVQQENGNICVTVKDSGVGISRDKLSKLFQIDQNISTAGTRNEEGSGLGLILCKEFINLNKGEITVKSKVGEGSEFKFTLPVFKL